MRHYCKISFTITIVLILLVQSGCQKQVRAPDTESMPPVDGLHPKITFEKTTYDFGEVAAGKKYTGQFRFTNTGSDVLKITDVKRCCGVVFKLDKNVLALDESGTLKFDYNTGQNSGQMLRQFHVFSNDKTNPKVILTIKAKVVIRIDYKPQKIDLLLNKENAGCPKITLRSLDKQPFSITSFQSTSNTITADVDPSVKATRFILEPKVDLGKQQKRSSGLVTISLTHPELDKVNIYFRTKKRFKLTPSGVFLLNPRPDEPNINKVSIVSNYDEEFEIESTSSEKGLAKVINQQAIKDGYRLEVEITPPPPDDETRMFTDMVNVNLKGGETLKIKCYVRYLSKEEK